MLIAALLVGLMVYLATGKDDDYTKWDITDLTEETNR